MKPRTCLAGLALLLCLALCACGMVSGSGEVDRPILGSAPQPSSARAADGSVPGSSGSSAAESLSGEPVSPAENASSSGSPGEGEESPASLASSVSTPLRGQYRSVVLDLHRMINETRAEEELQELELREDLCETAVLRALEAADFWSHTRPDGRDWDTALDEAGIAYRAAGENLFAANILDAETALQGWLESEAHRENLLRDGFTATGLGIVDGGDGYFYYAQVFITE